MGTVWGQNSMDFSSCLREKDHKLEANMRDDISACVRNCHDMFMLASHLIPLMAAIRSGHKCAPVGQRGSECG